jgi:uncharacterized protein YndB with AHSA1/START domain
MQVEQAVTVQAPPRRVFEALTKDIAAWWGPPELTGPLGTRWCVGLITFTLEPRGGATLLQLSHRALGEIAPDTEASYDEGWRDLLERRLPAFAERWERLGLRR